MLSIQNIRRLSRKLWDSLFYFCASSSFNAESPSLIFFTPRYKSINVSEEEVALNYKFDSIKNAFLSSDYEEGEEEKHDFDYNNTNILYKYKRLMDFSIDKKAFVIDEAPIFVEHCVN